MRGHGTNRPGAETSEHKDWAAPALRRLVLWWESPVWSGLIALVVYGLFTLGRTTSWEVSPFAYFNYLADAFLHGQLNLRLMPPITLDLSQYRGDYFLYWSPFPAVLLMPFVALWGVQVSDVLFTIVIAAANVSLVSLLLRQGCRRQVIRLRVLHRGILVLFFALGTVHFTLAPFGRVWATGQLVGFLCVVLAYLATLSFEGRRAFVFTGLALGCALATRNHLVFNGLWPACYLLYRNRAVGILRLLSYTLSGLAPVLGAVGLLALYNWLRFGNALDNGLAYHQMDPMFASDYRRYGAFNLHYLPTNLFYQYLAYPIPMRPTSLQGGSLFLLSPMFFATFWSIGHGRARWSTWALVGSMGLVAIPILLLMGTGWVQWGPRYTLDFTVPLLLLTAMGIRHWSIRTLSRLTMISVGHYLGGTVLFMRFL